MHAFWPLDRESIASTEISRLIMRRSLPCSTTHSLPRKRSRGASHGVPFARATMEAARVA